jgi:hypothetical protein
MSKNFVTVIIQHRHNPSDLTTMFPLCLLLKLLTRYEDWENQKPISEQLAPSGIRSEYFRNVDGMLS